VYACTHIVALHSALTIKHTLQSLGTNLQVLIVEDENGEIVRETTRDTEAIAQYKTMRETLVYLTHLHYEDTESIMLDKLAMQVSAAVDHCLYLTGCT
jgi:CRM1 / Exportin repeat 2